MPENLPFSFLLRHCALTLTLIAAASLVGCDSGGADKPNTDDGKTPAANKKTSSKKTASDVDKGTAEMKIGDKVWKAQRASAKMKDKQLRISASWSEMKEGKMRRESLTLVIDDFKGPGEYKPSRFGSVFVGLGIDTKKLVEPKTDQETTKGAIDMLKGAKAIMLNDARIEITKADDTAVDGTFDRVYPPNVPRPSITEGKFHAVFKK